MDDFGETDAAAEFLAREKETLGDMEAEIIADNGKISFVLLFRLSAIKKIFIAKISGTTAAVIKEEQMSSGSFEMVEKADDFTEDPAGGEVEGNN